MDEAKLAELERRSAALRGAAKGWLVLGPQGAADIIAAAREALTLRRLIEEHNMRMAQECADKAARDHSDGGPCDWLHERERCAECPQRDVIPLAGDGKKKPPG